MRSAVKRVPSIAVAGLIVVLAAACGSTASSGSGVKLTSLETTNLTVAAVPAGDNAGLYIAKDQNLFKQVGLNVTIDSIDSTSTAAQDQNSGKYDITAGSAVSYVQNAANGASNLEIVGEGALMQPGNQALYALGDSPISTVGQLKGKRIGVTGSDNIGTLLISALLYAHGLTASDVHFVPIAAGFPGMATALTRHQIDVAWLPEPYGSIDSASMGLREVADLYQGEAKNFPVTWYVATKTWAKSHPHTLTAFLYALREGQQLADTDRADVERAVEQLPEPYTVKPQYAAIMSIGNYPLNTAPDIDGARVQRVAEAMRQFSMLPSAFNVASMLAPLNMV